MPDWGHGATLLQANTSAGRHLPPRVTAVRDIDGARAREAAERYDAPVVTADFAEPVARPELDVIGIYTPGPLHAAQILAALDAGEHVMVTKSMVYTMAEAQQVVAAVERSGRVLPVSQSLRARLDFMASQAGVRRRRDRRAVPGGVAQSPPPGRRRGVRRRRAGNCRN